MLSIPHYLLDVVIPIPIWFRGDRSNYVTLPSSQGSEGPRRKQSEEMKGGPGESESCALSTIAGVRDKTEREPKKKQKHQRPLEQ